MSSVYVNPKQQQFLDANHRFKDIIAGRGFGKTSLMGHHNIDKLKFLPRGKSGLAALTFNQLMNNTLPPMLKMWDMCGLVEHTNDQEGHYVVGKKPPEWWAKPLDPPRKYEYVVSFINGYCIQLISVDRRDTVRGLSLDALDVDEKGFMKEKIYNEVLFPLVRGNIHAFDHPLHHSRCGFSSMPWLTSGQWILKAEELAEQFPDEYLYMEGTAEDNLAVLGENYLIDAQRTVPLPVYNVEYMNHRPKKVSNAFYPAFDEEKHCDFKTYDYDQTEAGIWISKSNDVHMDKPLEVSWDFNASFTSCTIHQDHGNELRQCDELYVETAATDLIDELTQQLIDKYQAHGNKDIFIYGDRNGNNKNPGRNLTFYEQIIAKLESSGWNCYLMVKGLDSFHQERYRLINKILSEKDPNLPKLRFNQNTCKYTIISIGNAGMVGDFKKDKSSEAPGNDQKRATHFSDCVDNIVMAKYSHLLETATEHYEAKAVA